MNEASEELLMQAGRLHQAGNLTGAEQLFRQVLAVSPDHFDALQGLGIVCYQQGRLQDAVTLIGKASALRSTDPVCLNNLGMASQAVGRYDRAEACFRHAIDQEPDYAEAWSNLAGLLQKRGFLQEALHSAEQALRRDSGLQQAQTVRDRILHADVSDHDLRDLFILSTAPEGLKGDFRGLRQRLAEQRGNRRMLVLAAAPKTASTWLANLLASLTGIPYTNLCYSFLQNEHDLYPPAMLACNRTGAISQLHMKGTLPNARLLHFFDARPVVLYRRLDDVVASLFDQFEDRAYIDSPNTFSFARIDANYAALERTEKLRFIIRMILPWYIQHYYSWRRLERDGEAEPIWLSFEDVTQNTSTAVFSILSAHGMQYDSQRIDQVIKEMQANRSRVSKFNLGLVGRGQQYLSASDLGEIESLTTFYADTDFRPVLPAR